LQTVLPAYGMVQYEHFKPQTVSARSELEATHVHIVQLNIRLLR
jgi:hypothetical protein